MRNLESSGGYYSNQSSEYITSQLITYIGNKRALIPFIGQAVSVVQDRLGKDKLDTLDLFAGTGVVSRYLKQHSRSLLVNDLELYSRITNECYLTNEDETLRREIESHFAGFESAVLENWHAGLIANLYAPESDDSILPGERVFYTRRNAEYIDTARHLIADLPIHLQRYFLAPLLAEASVHANTSGVFKGFYKNREGLGCFGGHGRNALSRITGPIKVNPPILSKDTCEVEIFQMDAGALVDQLPRVDLAYLDPPYNQHPYGSNYFMLNLIAEYADPGELSKVSGIPKDWNRSPYNKRQQAEDALFGVIDRVSANHVLISYNSEGFVHYDQFVNHLMSLGELEVFETKYNAFRGSRNLRERDAHVKEYLFLLTKG